MPITQFQEISWLLYLLVDINDLYFSFLVDWDRKQGQHEIQSITTSINTGPNEIQRLSTTADFIQEQKIIRTYAEDIDEIQTITTVANPFEKLAGNFTVVFDTTSTGGSIETSGPINFDALSDSSQSDRSTMKEILESMKNIGVVNVTRKDYGKQDGIKDAYTWVITFVDKKNKGNIPQLRLGESNLVGTGARVEFDTVREGNEIGGNFALEFQGSTTRSLPFDASSRMMTQALESLPGVDTVDIQRYGPSDEYGFFWNITFTGNRNSGDVEQLIPHSYLSGKNVTLVVCEDGNRTKNGCDSAMSIKGNEIGGTFDVTFNGNTRNISSSASVSDMKQALESIGTGRVAITREGPDSVKGYKWTISFLEKIGAIDEITANKNHLTGKNANIKWEEVSKGTTRVRIAHNFSKFDSRSFSLRFKNASTNKLHRDSPCTLVQKELVIC